MTRFFGLKATLALAHLALVVCGAARFLPAPRESRAARLVLMYGEYSGSNNGYGFFAPSVASPWDVRFSIYADGEGWVEGASPEGNNEVRLRFHTVLGSLSKDELREPVAASLAAKKFTSYPRAELINTHVRVLDLPTMEEYRAGQRPEWVTVNVYSFAHDPSVATAGE